MQKEKVKPQEIVTEDSFVLDLRRQQLKSNGSSSPSCRVWVRNKKSDLNIHLLQTLLHTLCSLYRILYGGGSRGHCILEDVVLAAKVRNFANYGFYLDFKDPPKSHACPARLAFT